ncbi:hypothetical protein ACFLR1_02640 [Bacteroidota bacterium]
MSRLISLILTLTLFSQSFYSNAQTKRRVKFPSKDGVTITADLYEVNPDYPWIVLFHQANSSRGEFQDIAPRLNMLELNCMAVDLRSGKEDNFIVNETYVLARDTKLNTGYLDAEQDMITAIEKAYVMAGNRPVIILGSSYSASLALKLAKEMRQIKAVLAFSPGEHFGQELNVAKTISGLSKPTFVTCASDEKKWTDGIITGIAKDKLIYFVPRSGGVHGARSLNKDTKGQTEYWIQVLNFTQLLRMKDKVTFK